jgi:hypothetical protein
MPFPAHIERVFASFGVPADTKAAVYDLYLSMGSEVLEVFGDIAERVGSPAHLRPEDTATIRAVVVERYLRRNHPRWIEGNPTPSFWHPREAEGRASGLVVPLGLVPEAAKRAIGGDQPTPEGVLILGRNAHFGGRHDTISFDVVASDLDDAIAIGQSVGQQHTVPGSVGETSGTYDSNLNIALFWETQPNVYKPAGERNRGISKIYRRHRNWHLVTLASALNWAREKGCTTFILRGEALATTHEVNPDKPVSDTIVELHNRTVQQVAGSLSLELQELRADDSQLLVNSGVMNHALTQHVARHGAGGSMWRVRPE